MIPQSLNLHKVIMSSSWQDLAESSYIMHIGEPKDKAIYTYIIYTPKGKKACLTGNTIQWFATT